MIVGSAFGGGGFLLLSSLFGVVAFVLAIVWLVLVRRSSVPGSFMALVLFTGGLGGAFMTMTGVIAAMIATNGMSRGRQLRKRGKVLLPDVESGKGEWADVKIDAKVEGVDRGKLAAAWRENGRTEHASVAAFGRLTVDLMALGAPPALIAGANRDALDEIRHTELCFSLARSLDGQAMSPAPFPEAQTARTLSPLRSIALAELAVDSLVDGALHEGVSARIVAKLVKRCESAEIRAILKEIAADEGRHAAHGWDVVEWCVEVGGANVARALLGALGGLPKSMHAELPLEAEDGAWEKHGIVGRVLEDEEFRKTRADVIRRTMELAARYLSAPASSSATHTEPSGAVTAASP